MGTSNLALWNAKQDETEYDASDPDALERLRARMDEVDRTLVSLLAERGRVARHIGRVKRSARLSTTDPAREAAVVRSAGRQAREEGLDEEIVRRIYWHVIELSHRIQMEEG